MDDDILLSTILQTGLLRVLFKLEQNELRVGDLKRGSWNPDGLVSFATLRDIRKLFKKYDLVKEEERKGPTTRGGNSIYLSLTPKGRRFVKAIKALGKTLSS